MVCPIRPSYPHGDVHHVCPDDACDLIVSREKLFLESPLPDGSQAIGRRHQREVP